MKWVTRELVHYDRIATPWLILRFVDPQPVWQFVPWGKETERDADAIPYGIPGVELSDHDEAGTTFDKTMTKYRLSDPGLTAMSKLIRFGVAHILANIAAPADDREGQIMPGLMAIAEGIMLSSKNDHETIDRMVPVFDGLYAMFMAEALMHQRGEAFPPTGTGEGLWRTVFVASLTGHVRKSGSGFDGRHDAALEQGFETALHNMRRAAVHNS